MTKTQVVGAGVPETRRGLGRFELGQWRTRFRLLWRGEQPALTRRLWPARSALLAQPGMRVMLTGIALLTLLAGCRTRVLGGRLQPLPTPPAEPVLQPPELPALGTNHGDRETRGTLSAEQAELEVLVGRLYDAFCFDAGAEPDWSVQRELFHPDCRFLGPVSPGREPRSEDLEQFLEGFAQFAREAQRGSTGLHERILDVQLWAYEGIAQARVLFEGHLPGELPAVTRGVDALQFVRTPSGWRIVGFAAQYERSPLSPQSLDGTRWASD